MDEGSGVAEGKAGGATGGGVDSGRPRSRLLGRLPFIKGVCSAFLPQTPAGGVRCWNRGGIEGIQAALESCTSVALAPCPEARRRWTCLLGTAPWTRSGTPTTGLYSPGAPRLVTSWVPASSPSGTAPAAVSLRPHLAPVPPPASGSRLLS